MEFMNAALGKEEKMNNTTELQKEKTVQEITETATDEMEKLRQKYRENGKQTYELYTSINEDDDTEKEYCFLFKKPTTASYDRYVKMSASSATKALRTFITDNICPEQLETLKELLEDYPALAICLGEKLLAMLGFSKDVQVKKL